MIIIIHNGERQYSFSYDAKGQLINNTKEQPSAVCNVIYPVFKGRGSLTLNLYCKRFTAALKSHCKNKIAVREQVREGKPPVVINLRYSLYIDGENSLSLCFDVSHGRNLPYRFSSVWSLRNGFPLSLLKVAGLSRKQLRERLAAQIESRMSAGLRIYYGDYKTLLKRRLNTDNWYMDNKGVQIFFQPGEIAPAIEGVQTFTLIN